MTQLKSSWLCLFVAAGLAFSFVGCGGDDEEDSEEETSSNSGGSSGTSKPKANGGSTQVGVEDRPNIDGIPIDVFFPEPLVTASETGEVVTSVAPTPATSGTEPETGTGGESDPPAEAKPAGDGAVAWHDVISPEMLKGEMKSIRLQLQQRLMTLASYNSSYLDIPILGSTLSLLAEVARRHPEDISWKKDAKYLRALGYEMVEVSSSAGARGRMSYGQVNGAFLKICDIIDNNPPAELPEVDEESDMLDAADFGYVMKRLERGMEWLQNNVGSEDGFKENSELAQREVDVIAAISQAIADPSYGYEEPDYVGHAVEMRDAAKEMSKAAEGQNFSTFDELRSKVDQKCTQCHMTYRTG